MSTIQQIFQDHTPAYLERFAASMPAHHRKAVRAICDCRSGACGHHLFACPQCAEQHVAKSSCGNRHCPVCQHEKSVQWVHQREEQLLPCNYFMATFTVPEALREVIRANQGVLYRALLDESAASLRTLEADPRFVGCSVSGFFGVLHTWGRQLQYHPHVHYVIPGGGLSEDREKWIPARGPFLVHVRALSALFRGKMKAAVRKAGWLDQVPEKVWNQDWVVHCKFVGDGRHTLKYLGAYVFRVAISDSRIVRYDGTTVTFKYQKVGSSRWRMITVSVFEFMRRFLQHVLPKGFMKVRHYGFLSPNFGVALQKIREMICVLYALVRPDPKPPVPPAKPKPLRCPLCRNVMKWVCYIPTVRSP
jgi:hypothetical protein